MKALIIKEYWLNLILSGEKTLEIRSSSTGIKNEPFCLLESKSHLIKGIAEINYILLLNKILFSDLQKSHCIYRNYEDIPYKKMFGWHLINVIKFNNPIYHKPKKGTIIWSNLPREVENLCLEEKRKKLQKYAPIM